MVLLGHCAARIHQKLLGGLAEEDLLPCELTVLNFRVPACQNLPMQTAMQAGHTSLQALLVIAHDQNLGCLLILGHCDVYLASFGYLPILKPHTFQRRPSTSLDSPGLCPCRCPQRPDRPHQPRCIFDLVKFTSISALASNQSCESLFLPGCAT